MLGDVHEILGLIARWLHILSAITVLGGSLFARFAVFPGLSHLSEADRQALHKSIRTHWSKFVHISFGLLLLTGLYNYAMLEMRFSLPMAFRMLFAVKFLLALAVMALGSLLVGRSPAADQLRRHAKIWIGVVIACGVTIVILSGMLRSFHTQGLPPRAIAATAGHLAP